MVQDKIIREIKALGSTDHVNEEYISLMAGVLNEDSLKELLAYYQSNLSSTSAYAYTTILDAYNRVKNSNKFKKQLHDKVYRINEPVNILLSQYEDKKSRKVGSSKKQLQARFLNLSYDEQIAIIKSFLQGCMSDREWCYSTLRKWWSDELIHPILDAWNTYHEEHCGWLFPRYMPVQIIREHVEELSYDSNYYHLCKRLANEPWFEIDRERLLKLVDDSQFMWVMTLTSGGLSADEAFKVVFGRVAFVVHYYIDDRDDYTNFYQTYGSASSYVKLSYKEADKVFYMHKLEKRNMILSSICKMGMYDEVRQFLEFDEKIHNEFLTKYAVKIDELRNGTPVEQDVMLYGLYPEYAQFVAERFPMKYKELLPSGIEEDLPL